MSLQKTKEQLLKSGNNYRVLANDKAQDLSVKKLTRDNPTMKAKFDQLKSKGDDDDEPSSPLIHEVYVSYDNLTTDSKINRESYNKSNLDDMSILSD